MIREKTETDERKEFAQIPARSIDRHLYPEWETTGAPYIDGGQKMVMLRKRINLVKEGDN